MVVNQNHYGSGDNIIGDIIVSNQGYEKVTFEDEYLKNRGIPEELKIFELDGNVYAKKSKTNKYWECTKY